MKRRYGGGDYIEPTDFYIPFTSLASIQTIHSPQAVVYSVYISRTLYSQKKQAFKGQCCNFKGQCCNFKGHSI